MTRALVTGATGFLGGALAARLGEDGHEVIALVRRGSAPARVAALRRRFEVVEADVADARGLDAAVARARPDVCFHLAAAGAVVRDGAAAMVETNALGPLRLVEALARHGCARVVTAGSSSEYGPREGAMRESDPAAPDDVYGAAKLAGGALALAAARTLGLEALHLRIFSAYGPGEDARRLVASVVRALHERRPLPLTLGGQVRDFVYVDDVARAFALAGRPGAPAGTSVNVGSGAETSVRELCLLAAEVTGADPALLRFGKLPYRAGERFSWRADTARARDLLGWTAATSLRDGLVRTARAEAAEAA